MKIKETKLMQEQRLKEISTDKGVDYDSLKTLLDSVRIKKLLKKNDVQMEIIIEVVIEKAIK